jgi:hypothetical protein
MLLARIVETLPLRCPLCHAAMRIIAFINAARTVRQILEHQRDPNRPPRIAPARGQPLRAAAAAGTAAGNAPQWELATQPLPQLEFDQRLAW